jgi:hypothetical protein
MANTLKFGSGQWATKVGSTLAYNDEGGNFKPLPFNFTRASSATRVNKDGLIEMVTNNKPRIDFLNDSNGALLLEPQRTNLFTYSEDFSVSDWTPYGGVVLTNNNAVSPEGVQNATKMIDAGGVFDQIPYTQNTDYTYSVFAKTDTATSIVIGFADQSAGYLGGRIRYTFATNVASVLVQSANGSVTAHREDYGNGWFRVIIRFKTNVAQNYNYQFMEFDGGDGWIYGAQLEAGSYATSYIPTQGGAVTRNADVISKTGISDLINGESGTLFLNSASLANDGTIKYFSINNGTTGYEIVFQYTSTSNTVGIRYINGGFAQCDDSVLITNALDFNKFAFTWQLNKFELWCNGIKVISDTSGSVTTGFNQIDFRRSNGTIPFFSKVKSVALYNTALTDQELINLTTI